MAVTRFQYWQSFWKKGCEKCLPTGPRSCHCTDCATEALVFFETQKTDGGRNTDFHVYILFTSLQLKVRFTSLSLPNSTVMNMEEKCMFLTQHQQSTTQYSVKSTVREPSSLRLLFLSAEQSHTAGMSFSMLGPVLTNTRGNYYSKDLTNNLDFFPCLTNEQQRQPMTGGLHPIPVSNHRNCLFLIAPAGRKYCLVADLKCLSRKARCFIQ